MFRSSYSKKCTGEKKKSRPSNNLCATWQVIKLRHWKLHHWHNSADHVSNELKLCTLGTIENRMGYFGWFFFSVFNICCRWSFLHNLFLTFQFVSMGASSSLDQIQWLNTNVQPGQLFWTYTAIQNQLHGDPWQSFCAWWSMPEIVEGQWTIILLMIHIR